MRIKGFLTDFVLTFALKHTDELNCFLVLEVRRDTSQLNLEWGESLSFSSFDKQVIRNCKNGLKSDPMTFNAIGSR